MKILGALLLCVSAIAPAFSGVKESLQLEVSLTTGERSKDSSSETQVITVEGNKLVWERSSMGHGRGKQAPMRKEFPLSDSDKENLRRLIRANDLLVTEAIALPRSTPNFYFGLSIEAALDGKKGAISMSGPRSASAIREEPLYQKSLRLVEELYRILHAQDKSIRFEKFIREPIPRAATS